MLISTSEFLFIMICLYTWVMEGASASYGI